MTEVTKDQFFAALYADPRDIMPENVSTKGPGKSIWALNGVRNAPAFGESIGHDWTTNTPPRYWLAVVPVASRAEPLEPNCSHCQRVALNQQSCCAFHY